MTKALSTPSRTDAPRHGLLSIPLAGTVAYLAAGGLWLLALGEAAELATLPLMLFSAVLVNILLRRAGPTAEQAVAVPGVTLDSLADMVIVGDADRRILGWNRAAAAVAGFDGLWLGRRLDDAFAAADAGALAAGLADDGTGGEEFEARLVSAAGTTLPCRWTVAAAGKALLLTGRRGAANGQSAADRERVLRQMVDTVGQLLAIVAGGNVVFINRAGVSLLGADSAGAVTGLAWAQLCQAQRGTSVAKLRRCDGSTVDVDLASIPIVYDGRPATLVQGRDITELQRTVNALEDSDSHRQLVLDLIADAVLTVDQDGTVRAFNRAAERIFGYGSRDMLGRSVNLLLPRAQQDTHERAIAALAGGTQAPVMERTGNALRKDGSEFPAEITVAETRGRDGRMFTTVVRDISERRRTEGRLLVAEKVLECTVEGVMVTDPRGAIQWVNSAFCKISGFDRDEVMGENASLLKSGFQGGDFYKTMWQHLRAVGHWEGEIWNRRKDGEAYLEWLNIRAVTNEAGIVTHYVGVFSDISRHKRAEETIKHLTYYDGVTRLPNRYLFRDRVTQALERAQRANRMVALVLVGLDRFKQVNETLGHSTGDALLREVAERLLRSVRGQDTVARLRGDTFCCVLTDLTHGQDSTPVVNRVLESFTPSFLLGGHELFATSSLGISIYPVDGSDVDDLVQKAEAAMNRSKDRAESTYHFYTPEMNANSMERLRLETDLRKAITQNDLVLYYQPKVDTQTGRMVGSEALVRWQHYELGMIPPGKFIPIAEETGLILPIGKWVLKEACRQIREWQGQGLAVSRVAVNLSAHQFRQPDLVETVVRVLEETGVAPDLIELELTESAVMHNAEIAVRRMLALHEAGIRIAIDDFGTGYSSLSHLKRFPLDKLKIDRSFIQDLGSSPAGEEIVGAIIAMAHSLNLTVVAEGVEKASQLDLLRRLRCDEIQGFYFSRPVPATAFAELLKTGVLVGKEAA